IAIRERRSSTRMTETATIPDPGTLRAEDYRGQDSLEFLTTLVRRHGDRVRYQTSVGRFLVINHPSAVQQFARNDTFRRLSFLRLARGQGLLTSEGSWGRRQRQLAQPLFTPERVTQFAPLISAWTLAAVPAWERHADTGEPLVVADEMARLA